jgi:hypothetical protein
MATKPRKIITTWKDPAGQGWFFEVDGLMDTANAYAKTEAAAIQRARKAYPGCKVISTKSPSRK